MAKNTIYEKNTKEIVAVLEIVKAEITGDKPSFPKEVDWKKVYHELGQQAVVGMSVDVIGNVSMDSKLQSQWTSEIFYGMKRFSEILIAQEEMFEIMQQNDIDLVILKGAAVACYYPKPESRTMGDIDFILPENQFDDAHELLIKNGYRYDGCTDPRHNKYDKNGVCFEMHRNFSLSDDSSIDKILDQYIFEAIQKRRVINMNGVKVPMLPELENGLVLLSHLNQHLEEGVGLRHIIDWLMYAKEMLSDEYWNQTFKEAASKIGLKKLAMVTTKMGQLYLGIPTEHMSWCESENEELCEELMQYVIDGGNFGLKDKKGNDVAKVLYNGRGIKGFFLNLQKRGEEHWILLKKYRCLRPFAWIYQACRYVHFGLRFSNPWKDLMHGIKKSRKRPEFLRKLGVTRICEDRFKDN